MRELCICVLTVWSAGAEIGRLRHQDDIGTALARFLDVHHVLDAVQLGLARAGNHTRMYSVLERHHAYRLAAQVRMHLLLDTGEEAVEVEIQAFDFSRSAHNFSAFSQGRS